MVNLRDNILDKLIWTVSVTKMEPKLRLKSLLHQTFRIPSESHMSKLIRSDASEGFSMICGTEIRGERSERGQR